MLSFTKCQDPKCGEILTVTWVGQETHPGCKNTPAEDQARAFVDALQRGDQAEADRLERELAKPSPALGPSALWYAKQGWPVFPLRPRNTKCDGDKKCVEMGACQCSKKPPKGSRGFKDASTDLVQVKAWWTKTPDANIGLATGHNFDVIDIDGPVGIQSLSEMEDGAIPEVHGKVSTPRGFHLYVLPTGDGCRAGVVPGIDYRGDGGYVIAPPSKVGKREYTWVERPSPLILGAK